MAIALDAASIAVESVAVAGDHGGESAGVDDDGVRAQHARASTDTVKRAVVELGVRSEQRGFGCGERGLEDRQRGWKQSSSRLRATVWQKKVLPAAARGSGWWVRPKRWR